MADGRWRMADGQAAARAARPDVITATFEAQETQGGLLDSLFLPVRLFNWKCSWDMLKWDE
jgi:hypothetical protein